MRSKIFIFALVVAVTLPATAQAAPKFRRPLDNVLAPAISAHYDHDTSAGLRRYTCGNDAVYNDHKGTDFRATVGTPVYAAAYGGLYHRINECETYGYIGSNCGGGYGNHVRIDHEGSVTDGYGWVSVYAHLERNSPVYQQSVWCGSLVGKSGSSGNSSGPHLHFEVKKYGFPYDDPFSGSCSHADSWWANQGAGVPTAQCG